MEIKDFFKKDHFAQHIGAELLEVREGYARARLLVDDKLLNGAGVCQGGALFTFADLTFAAAVNSHGILTVTTNSNIVYVKSAKPGYLLAEAHEVVNHHKMPYGEVRITDEEGNLIAIFSSSAYRKTNVKLV